MSKDSRPRKFGIDDVAKGVFLVVTSRPVLRCGHRLVAGYRQLELPGMIRYGARLTV